MKDFLHKTLKCALVGVLLAQAGLVSARTRPNVSFIYQIPAIRQQLSKKELRKYRLKRYKGEAPENRKKAYDLFIKLYQENPELAEELGKIPDFADNNISDKDLEALVNITNYYFESKNPKIEEAVEQMLDVGIKGKRTYCSPLEALKWVAEKYKFKKGSESYVNDPLSYYNRLSYFLDDAWDFSEKERWSDFKKVTDRLNSPELVSIYTDKQISSVPDDSRNINQTALQTFKRKAGDCEDHAMFQAYMLKKNDYWAYVLDVQRGRKSQREAYGHAECLYKDNGLFYTLGNRGYQRGPFNEIIDAVNRINPNWKKYSLLDLNWRAIKTKYKR